ncbi:MAG: hypothetical protein IJX28_09295 [Clostridia bacterium]|nr:hypothetical protein [Clostridia bacterium]
MEEKMHGKPKFTWVDWLLLALFLLLIVGLLVAILQWRFKEEESAVFHYTVLIPGVKKEWINTRSDLLLPGTPICSENGTALLGQILSAHQSSHTVTHFLKGEVWEEEDPALVDLSLLVEGRGRLSAGEGVRICDIRIAAGGSYSLRIGPLYAPNAKIVSVEEGGTVYE